MPTRKHIFPVVMVAVVLSVLGAAPRAAERVALVIGNAAYEHTTTLRNPRNDAGDVARSLEGLGFEGIEGLDLDERAFEGKLREFAKAGRGAAVTVFFYAGHGLQVEGENYLVPTDAKLAEEVDLRLEAFELAAFLRQMRGDTNLVFLDACERSRRTGLVCMMCTGTYGSGWRTAGMTTTRARRGMGVRGRRGGSHSG